MKQKRIEEILEDAKAEVKWAKTIGKNEVYSDIVLTLGKYIQELTTGNIILSIDEQMERAINAGKEHDDISEGVGNLKKKDDITNAIYNMGQRKGVENYIISLVPPIAPKLIKRLR